MGVLYFALEIVPCLRFFVDDLMTSSRMLLARSSMIISIFPLFLVAFFGLAAVHDCQGVWQNCHFMNYNFCYSEQTILNTGAIVM